MKWYEILEKLQTNNALPSRIMLWGLPGVGKTYFGTKLRGDNHRSVTITRGTQPEELTGMYCLEVTNGATATVWKDGPLVQMMRSGGVIIFNEIDHAGSELDGLFYCAGDDPSIMALTLPTGEVVRPAHGFTVIATSNVSPGELPEPIADRFSGGLILHCLEPHPGATGRLHANLARVAANHYAHVGKSAKPWRAPLSYRSLSAFDSLRGVLGDQLAASLLWGADVARDVVASVVIAGDAAKQIEIDDTAGTTVTPKKRR